MKRLLATIAVLVASSGILFAEHPNEARGFAADRAYSFHDVDTVNAYNGNMVIRIPIGPEYKVNGSLSYQLLLTYNSHLWRFEDQSTADDPDHIVALQRSEENAGLGWRLSLGQLYQPNDPDNADNTGTWMYRSADGAAHHFDDSQGLTHDGSYLRLSPAGSLTNPTVRQVAFPDGVVHTFKQLDGTWAESPTSGKWYLTSMSDPFGNTVSIGYTSTLDGEIWTIADGARTTTVSFKLGTLDRVDLQAVGQQALSYTFAYESLEIARPSGDTSGEGSTTVHPAGSINVGVLTAITPSTGNGYSMILKNDPSLPPAQRVGYDSSTTRTSAGVLTRLVLPTLGAVGWTYTQIPFAPVQKRSPSINIPTGIATRSTYGPNADASTQPLATWTYSRFHSKAEYFQVYNEHCPPNQQVCVTGLPRQMTVFITDPPTEDGITKTTISYFSNYEIVDDPYGDTQNPPGGGWLTAEHGLPFTRYKTKAGRFLSSEVRTGFDESAAAVGQWESGDQAGQGQVPPSGTSLRETYLTYRLDAGATNNNFGDFDYNASLSSTATYYTDDNSCGGTCFTATNYGLFDGYGHYKQTSTEGNLPGNGNFRTTFTNYNAAPTSTSWLLTPFTEQCAVDEDRLRAEMPVSANCASLAAPPSGGTILSGPFVKQYCFDGNGFLTRQRSLAGSTPGSHDLLAVFTQLNGNVAQEDYYGGDAQSLGLEGSVCAATLPSPSEYSILHTYEHGILRTSNHRPKSGDPVIYEANYSDSNGQTGIDGHTGLVTASTDPSGLTTHYVYDPLGRLTDMIKPGEALIHADYNEATSTSAAQVVLTQNSAAGLTQSTTIFDGLGRLVEEQRLMPAGTARRQTIYSASGLKWKISEWEGTPSHFTVFSNFDAFGRPQATTLPDLSTISTIYTGARSVARTVSVGTSLSGSSVLQSNATTTETYDGMGRLITVDQPGISTASYGYDAANHLTSVSLVDHTVVPSPPAQPRTFAYDGRGLLTSEQHPENGTTSYRNYDSRGHAGKKLAGPAYSPFDLKYEYDALERLVNVYQLLNRTDPPGVDQVQFVKQFNFATANAGANYTQGKLVTAVRRNYLPSSPGTTDVTETYGYSDSAGRLTDRTTEVKGPNSVTLQKYAQSYTYNDAGLPATITYPICPDTTNAPCASSSSMISSISPTYQNGLLRTVPGFATSVIYDLNGLVTQIVHPGGISDLITPDPNKMARPAEIQFNGYDPCSSPVISGPAGQQIPSGSHPTLQVNASGTPPFTYEWFKDNSTTPIAGETASSCCSATMTTSATFVVSVINSCGNATSLPVSVTVCGSPSVSVSPSSANYTGSPITLTASANGCAPLSYQWYIGDAPAGSPIAGATAPSFTVSNLQATTHYWVRVTDSVQGTANSNTAIVSVSTPLPTPGALTATYNPSTNQVTVSWGTSTGADHYELQRLDAGVWTTSSVGGISVSYTLTQNTTYVFHVRAVDSSGGRASNWTANDLATTMTFVTIQGQVTKVAFSHFDQILTAINKIRAANSDGPKTWRDILNDASFPSVPVPASNGLIYAAHLKALRAAMTAALSHVGVATPGYSEDPLPSPATIKAMHLTELQQRAQ